MSDIYHLVQKDDLCVLGVEKILILSVSFTGLKKLIEFLRLVSDQIQSTEYVCLSAGLFYNPVTRCLIFIIWFKKVTSVSDISEVNSIVVCALFR